MDSHKIGVNVNIGGIPKLNNGAHTLSDGTRIYTRGGDKHRDKGPAEIRPNGYKAYFIKGLRDRKNGPAVIHPDGTQEYWLKGKLLKVIPGDKSVPKKKTKIRRKH